MDRRRTTLRANILKSQLKCKHADKAACQNSFHNYFSLVQNRGREVLAPYATWGNLLFPVLRKDMYHFHFLLRRQFLYCLCQASERLVMDFNLEITNYSNQF